MTTVQTTARAGPETDLEGLKLATALVERLAELVAGGGQSGAAFKFRVHDVFEGLLEWDVAVRRRREVCLNGVKLALEYREFVPDSS